MSASYDAIAKWYDTLVHSDSLAGDLVIPHLLTLLGNVQAATICDLACGQGRIARLLAQRGAQVMGVDLSPNLIAIAQSDEAADPVGITYAVDTAHTLALLADEQFHGVVCNLALMDIADLDAVYHAVWRILRPDGWFVFSITHPCFEAPYSGWRTDADGTLWRETAHYFDEGFWRSTNPLGVRGQVGAHHRTLSTYVTGLHQTKFIIETLLEPQPTAADKAAAAGAHVVPSFLLLRCRKAMGAR